MKQDRILLLVRHGRSESNAGQSTQEAAEINLTSEGRAQAEAVAARWSWPRPDFVVVSPYRRTLQTALPLLQRFGLAYETWDEAREFTYLARPDRPQTPTERAPAVQAYWSEADVNRMDQGAESFADFWQRTRLFAQRAVDASARSNLVVVFTHGLLIEAFDLQQRQPELVVDAGLMQALNLRRVAPVANCEQLAYHLEGGRWARLVEQCTRL